MGATATLSTSGLAVEIGQEVSCSVVIRNSGGVVDQFMIEVVGQPGAWATAEPRMVNLLPEESTTVTIRFAPPRAAAIPAGPAPFGVRVSSREDPAGSVVEEGVIEVAPFADLTVDMVPPKKEAASRARYQVAVDNRGNYPVAVEFAASDPEGDLDFRFQRNEIVLEPDTTAFVRLSVRPRDRFWRGQPVRHRFTVAATPAERPPITAEATLVQRQLLPKWLVPALLMLLVLALVLFGMWWFVLNPAVKSAAGDAAAREAQQVKAVAEGARQEAGAARQDSGAAQQKSNRALEMLGVDPASVPTAGPADGTSPTTTPPPRTLAAAGTPTDFRVAADAPIDANFRRFREFAFAPAESDKTLVITDAILQNPRGDLGTLRVLRVTPTDERQVMLEVGLGNFRDLDQHWVQPLVFKPGERVVVAVSCQNAAPQGNCTPAVFFSGRLEG